MLKTKPINRIMRDVGHKFGLVHDFAVVCNSMMNVSRNYDERIALTVTEMCTVMEIAAHPGITATDLCSKWNRTRGAISQLLKKIETKGFIYREKSRTNEKVVLLYPTDEGIRLKNRVTLKEFNDSTNILRKLMEMGCSIEDLSGFYKVVECYTQVLLHNPDIQWVNMVQENGDDQG